MGKTKQRYWGGGGGGWTPFTVPSEGEAILLRAITRSFSYRTPDFSDLLPWDFLLI